jgi:hypothetical protein
MARLGKTLGELAAYLKEIKRIDSSGPPSDVFEAIDQFHKMRRMEKPLRIFEARLLRDLRVTRAVYALGFRRVSDFLEDHLGLSERAARSKAADAELFEDIPSMEEAYVRGEVSLGQAHRIKSLTYGRGDKAYIRRASEVTDRQFDWEYRFQIHLRQCFPELASRFQGPLPQPGLEEALIVELCGKGWKKEEIEIELCRREIAPLQEGCSLDPAENRVVMHRLEALLDLLIATRWADRPEVDDRLLPRDRQTFGLKRTPVYIRVRVPRETAADWRGAIKTIQARLGPFTPEWKAALVLFAHVHEEWSRVDPESKPTQWKVLKRDKYLCQAPGCPKRGTLESHHMEYLSQGGSDEDWNKVILCHGDHQHEVHTGYARVSGEAPQAVKWELGCRPGHEPLLILNGEKIVGGTRARASRQAPATSTRPS